MKRHKITEPKPNKRQAVDRLLAQLLTMDRKALLKLWRDLFDRAPSAALRRETLIPVLAYRIQEKVFGGLKASTARKLRESVEKSAVGETSVKTSLRPKTGTRYVREYDGKLHEVTVLDAGYEHEGATYRSLTEIANIITGSKWSGPAFFGLNRKARREVA